MKPGALKIQKSATSFFVDDPAIWIADWKIASHFLPHARIKTLAGGVFLPLRYRGKRERPELLRAVFEGGLCDSHGRFVAGRRRSFWNDEANFSCLHAYSIELASLKNCDETVIFGGVVFDHYGHLLTDTTARLWYVVTHPEDTRRIVLLTTPEKSEWSSSDCLQFLRMAGIPEKRILFVEQPTRFRSVLVPEEAVYSLDAVRPEWISFFDAVRDRIKPSPFKKVYLSRTHFKRADTFNEELFETYWGELGFHVVHPEDCSLEEEVSFIAGADELVSTIGTLSHNFLFAKPGTRATILLRTNAPQRLQLLVGAARGLRCDYVQAHRNVLPSTHNDGTFWLAPTPQFRRFLHARGLPPFGEARTSAAYSQEKVSAYVDKWAKVFAGRAEFADALLHSEMMAPPNVARLRTALQTTADEAERRVLIERFVAAELARWSVLDESPDAPVQCPAVSHGRLWWAARHFKLCCLHRKHDL